MSLLGGMYNCSGGSYIHIWNANAFSDCTSSPRFPASCPLRFAKTIPHRLQRISSSSIPVFIKVSWQIFTLITYAYCMSYCWMQVASQGLRKTERRPPPLHWGFVSCHICADVSLQVMKHVDSKEEIFDCDVRTHPSKPSHCYILHALSGSYLRFHRLSCFLSSSGMTGRITTARAICGMSFHTFDKENEVWGIPQSDRWEMLFQHSTTICSAFSTLISN